MPNLSSQLLNSLINSVSQELLSKQNQITSMPKGKIVSSRHNGHTKYYQSISGEKKYIPSKNISIAQQLLNKQLLEIETEQLEKILKNLNDCLICKKTIDNHKENTLSNPSYSKLIPLLPTELEIELIEWNSKDYIRNSHHPDGLKYPCESGNIVRSKSESIIDSYLFSHNIPYRYECELEIEGLLLFPDFTIRRPRDGKTFYWEHFGMMDNEAYINSHNVKLSSYISAGIIPSISLITSYEDNNHPLTVEEVHKIVEHYIL